MKKQMKKKPSMTSDARTIEFCDLSSDLDRRLSWAADLLERTHDENDPFQNIESETGHFLFEYLGKRAVLEHVFFGRSLRSVRLETSQLRAELWRLHKIRAKQKLNLKA
jgi:hypothetical protein